VGRRWSGTNRAGDCQVDVRWTARYDGQAQDTDAASAIAVSPDEHRIYVTGTSKGASTGEDFVTVAFSG